MPRYKISQEESHDYLRPGIDLIVIAGAGVAGLGAALKLQQHGYRCVVYEKDTTMDYRSQGYGVNECGMY